jgi:hypothetical protein
LDVGWLESLAVLEAEAEGAVEGDVGDPDGGELRGEARAGAPGNAAEDQGQEIAVHGVVDGRGQRGAVPERVAEQRKIGGEEQDSEEPPAPVEEHGVGGQADGENQQGFESEEQVGAGHGAGCLTLL